MGNLSSKPKHHLQVLSVVYRFLIFLYRRETVLIAVVARTATEGMISDQDWQISYNFLTYFV